VASDAFFPFPDGLTAAADAGATAAIQPGGSVKDAEVIAAADARGMAMAFTGANPLSVYKDLVVGAGFGGLTFCQKFPAKLARLTLIDIQNHGGSSTYFAVGNSGNINVSPC